MVIIVGYLWSGNTGGFRAKELGYNKKRNSLGTDLTRLINESKISKIYANGGKAEDGYNWFAYEKIGIPIEKLPGSGGANTHMTYSEKLEAWSVIKQYI